MTAPDRLLVACLCAAWCGTCREYEAVFDAGRAADGGAADWVWVDIEDEDEVLGPIDVENFPTLLIARGDTVLFFGTVTPHAQTLLRLVQNARAGDFPPQTDAQLHGLPGRVRAVLAG
ncbi:thioredoxin domain-containing protein [Aquincola sp. MAHUQ-54]|uniref:Thioredoxin domain-containing protein n=1 Tax=Aquincola agrisoli TaxID=3119538 RepID=A0AAW9QNU1_9BURK